MERDVGLKNDEIIKRQMAQTFGNGRHESSKIEAERIQRGIGRSGYSILVAEEAWT